MGVSSYCIIIPEETLNVFPKSINDYLKELLKRETLFNKSVYVGCAMELSDWMFDNIELSKADKLSMIKIILDQNGYDTTGYLEIDREDDDSYEECVVKALEESDSLICRAWFESIEEKYDFIYMISHLD